MISLNEIPWESITLPIFKYWCDLLIYGNTVKCSKIMGDIPSKNLMNLKSENLKVIRFFFRGLIHLKKMNSKTVDDNINAQKSESSVVSSKESFLILVMERINHCKTIQDLIDSSPTAECPVCKDVTFTESSLFQFRVGCNHLVCLSCHVQLTKFNKKLVNKYITFIYFD